MLGGNSAQAVLKIQGPEGTGSLYSAGTEFKGNTSQHWRCIKISLPSSNRSDLNRYDLNSRRFKSLRVFGAPKGGCFDQGVVLGIISLIFHGSSKYWKLWSLKGVVFKSSSRGFRSRGFQWEKRTAPFLNNPFPAL